MFLSRNGIQHLVLQLPYDVKLPSSVFKCLQLRHLTIENCLIVSPPDLKKFDRLISVELSYVTISSKLLESFISNCPILQKLVLYLIQRMTNIIEINAPMLTTFDFRGSIQFICLKNVPLLAKVLLRDYDSSLKSRKCDIANFFKSVPVLEYLYLNYGSLKFLGGGAGGVPTRLPFDLKFVKCLCLFAIDLDRTYPMSCALRLIKSCPYLEYMEIDQVYSYDDDSPEREGFSDVMFCHLKEVKFRGSPTTKIGMQLIKPLLGNSPVLEKMLITTYIDVDVDDDLESFSRTNSLLALVNVFRRASPKAEVVFDIAI